MWQHSHTESPLPKLHEEPKGISCLAFPAIQGEMRPSRYDQHYVKCKVTVRSFRVAGTAGVTVSSVELLGKQWLPGHGSRIQKSHVPGLCCSVGAEASPQATYEPCCEHYRHCRDWEHFYLSVNIYLIWNHGFSNPSEDSLRRLISFNKFFFLFKSAREDSGACNSEPWLICKAHYTRKNFKAWTFHPLWLWDWKKNKLTIGKWMFTGVFET